MGKNACFETSFFVRQPVFGMDREIWGYELHRKESPEEAGRDAVGKGRGGVQATIAGILSTGRKMILKAGDLWILEDAPFEIPPLAVAVKISEKEIEAKKAGPMIREAKEQGCLVVLEGYADRKGYDKILQAVDMVSLDVEDRSPGDIAKDLERYRGTQVLTMARPVPDIERFEELRGLGFSFFQGAFFKEPEVVEGRKLSSHQISHFKIFQMMEEEDPDVRKMAEIIQADVHISFRLLTFLNSAAFGFSEKVRSIQQALKLLGWKKVKAWLRVVLLMDMVEGDEGSELLFLSVQRGKFLEVVAQEHSFLGFDPGSLFLLGEFSLLDTILGMEMREIVQHLPLEQRLKGALCRERNNEYLPFLQLAELFEDPDWEELESLMQLLALDFEKVANAVFVASMWVEKIFLKSRKPTA